MAVRAILSVIQANYNAAAGTDIYAGMAVGRDANGYLVPADRSDATIRFVGVAADDTVRTGATMILADPVGATGIVSGTFTGEANAYYRITKRAISDFIAENVRLNDTGSSTEPAPRRGVGVFTTPSTQLITDQFVYLGETSATTTDTTGTGLAINDSVCEGAGATNKGKFVKLANTSHGTARAVVDKIEGASNELLWVTLL